MLCHGFKNAKPRYIDVTNAYELDLEMVKVDLVVSLIPYTFHIFVIEPAIRNKKHVVTTSYISPALKDLHDGSGPLSSRITLLILLKLRKMPGLLYSMNAASIQGSIIFLRYRLSRNSIAQEGRSRAYARTVARSPRPRVPTILLVTSSHGRPAESYLL